MAAKLKVLFLCTGNACRSQMSEAWVRNLRGDLIEPYSAGILAAGIDPRAEKVMAEVGVSFEGQYSKYVDEVMGVDLDYVVTVCDNAAELCPIFPGKVKVVHHGFDDPPSLAAACETEEDRLVLYRRVRDEIRAFIEMLPDALTKPAQQKGE